VWSGQKKSRGRLERFHRPCGGEKNSALRGEGTFVFFPDTRVGGKNSGFACKPLSKELRLDVVSNLRTTLTIKGIEGENKNGGLRGGELIVEGDPTEEEKTSRDAESKRQERGFDDRATSTDEGEKKKA